MPTRSRPNRDDRRRPKSARPAVAGQGPSGLNPPRPVNRRTSATQTQPQRENVTSPRDLLAAFSPDLARILAELEAPSYRYQQVLEHLFRQGHRSFSVSTVLPGAMRAALDAAGTYTLGVETSQTAPDRTTKLLLRAVDGAAIEMVIMRYRERVTACISSQVGCPVGCAFCATGQGGFERNLTAAEIVDQVRIAAALVEDEGRRLSNLGYMGLGEPLLNLQAVLDSIRVVTHPAGLGLGHRSISISTVGIPAGIRRLGRNAPQVNLALSLHAADDRTRARLIPETYRHPLDRILTAAWEHFEMTHRKLLVEYVLIEGVNDSTTDARRLAALLVGHVVTVNLLTWNPVGLRSLPGTDREEFRPSSKAAVIAFRDALQSAGVETVIRQSKGVGIDAACGQLAGRTRPTRSRTSEAGDARAKTRRQGAR